MRELLTNVIAYSAYLWALLASAVCAEDAITVPFLKTAPVIDGKIEPKEWQFAAATTGFVDYRTGRVVDLQPVLYLGYDDQNLYVGAILGDHLQAQCVNADSPEISTDDTVELVVAPRARRGFQAARVLHLPGGFQLDRDDVRPVLYA